MNRNTIAALVGSVALCTLIGCANNQAAMVEDESQCKAIKPGIITTVNSMCVVVNDDPVNPAVEPAMWKGQKVGFCCNGCKPGWAKMNEAQKDAALARALATPTPK